MSADPDLVSNEVLQDQLGTMGFPASEQIAIGMQGAVYRLPGRRIG